MEPLRPDDPRNISRYQVLARLGSGGMGQVYLGASPGGRPVAIKVVHAFLAGDPGFRMRFRHEVLIAQAVGGVFTAPVVEAAPDAPLPWMATDYCPGYSLLEAVQVFGPLPLESVWPLGVGLAEALRSIHRAGVVHRDLKPSNVLLGRDGPRVIDFGIARAADLSALTRTGEAIGSPGHMAPEHLTRGEAVPASDVFSLGAVLAFAATGREPFGTGETHEILHRTLHEPPDLGEVPDGELRELLAACLDKDPSRRPAPEEVSERMAERAAVVPEGTAWLPDVVDAGIRHRLTEPVPPPMPRRRGISRRALLVSGGVLGTAGIGAGAAYRVSAPYGRGPIRWALPIPGHDPQYGSRLRLSGDLLYVQAQDTLSVFDPAARRLLWKRTGLPLELIGKLDWDDELLYLRDGQGYSRNLSAVVQRTGAALWSKEVLSRTDIAIGTTGDLIYVLTEPLPEIGQRSRPDVLQVLDRWTGAQRAHRPLAEGASRYGQAVGEDAVFFLYDRQRLGSCGLVSLDPRWSVELALPAVSGPVLAGDLVLVLTGVGPSSEHTLAAFAAADGAPRWTARFPFKSHGKLFHLFHTEQVICMSGFGDSLQVLNRRTGEERWTFAPAAASGSVIPDVARAAGRLFALSYPPSRLHAFDEATGRVLWEQELRSSGGGTPPVVAGGLLHFGDGDNGVCSADPETGRIVREVASDHRGRRLLAPERLIPFQDVLLFGSTHGEVLALPARDS